MNKLKAEPTEDDESFELLETLGWGGFARTYLARVCDEELIQEFGTDQVALKIPLNKQKARALKRDIELNAALHLRLKDMRSVNIVRYLGFDFYKGQPVMVMHYMPNGSLRKIIGGLGRQKRLPIEETVRITIEVLKGLAVIHGEHVFHRDIKPDNVLMEGTTPKIADFGISRMLETNEMASSTVGTIYYMSPEILGKGASFPSDIWSMGVMLYEMATGRLPFGDNVTSIGEMADLIRVGSHVPAHEVCPDIPVPLSKVIDCALCKQPAKRFSSAREMEDALVKCMKKPDAIEQEMAAVRELMSRPECNDDVEAKLRKLVVKYPQNPKAYLYLGEFYNRGQRPLDAIEAFQKGLQLDPQNALLHWYSALAAQGLGRQRDAVMHLNKALALDLDPSLRRFAETLLRSLKSNAL